MIKNIVMMLAMFGMTLGVFSVYKIRKLDFYKEMLKELLVFIKENPRGSYITAFMVVLYNFILTYVAVIYLGGNIVKCLSVAVIITNFIDILKIKMMESEKYNINRMYIYNYLSDIVEAGIYITYCAYIIYLVI